MTGQIEIIAEHSVRFPVVGPVLDVGCRSFGFSKEMARRGHLVTALDPDPTVQDPILPFITFRQWALVGIPALTAPQARRFRMDPDPQARRLSHEGEVEVSAVNLTFLMGCFGVAHWGLVKLDCEGAEYEILLRWPGPIADQITVEFHEHVAPKAPEVYDAILKHLGQWYDVIQHEKSLRHCLGTPNYWDSLFCLRGA